MKELLDMFLTFARIGGFTFGGGYAMLPMLQKEVVNGRHWATDEELMDYYAIGQCTPGIIAVNTATFVGYKNRGIPGAIAATLGVIAPSLVIIMIIAAFISNFIELSAVSSAFAGIRACVCVLIGSAVVKLAKKSLVDKGAIAIAAVVFVLSLFTSVSPALLVVVAVALRTTGASRTVRLERIAADGLRIFILEIRTYHAHLIRSGRYCCATQSWGWSWGKS